MSGSQEFPTKDAIGAFVEQHGAYANASTSADMLELSLDFGDQADLPEMIGLLRQDLTASLFEPATIDQERGAIKAELGGKISSPGSYIHRLWKQVAYQGTPIGHDTLGTEESLADISKDDLYRFYQTRLAADQAGIVISGDIMADAAIEALEGVMRSPRQAPDLIAAPAGHDQPVMVKRYPGSPQTHIALGFDSVTQEHPDYWPLVILTRIVGRGRISWLFRRLRYELGLVYGVGMGQESYQTAGRLVVRTDCKQADTPRVLEVIGQELAKAKRGDITQDELDHTQTFLLKYQKLMMDSASSWSDYHIDRVVFDLPIGDITHDLESMQAVQLADVRRVAAKYIQPDQWYIALCGDVEEGEVEFRLD